MTFLSLFALLDTSVALKLVLLAFLILLEKRRLSRFAVPVVCYCLIAIDLFNTLFTSLLHGSYSLSSMLGTLCLYLPLSFLGLAFPGRQKRPASAGPPLYGYGGSSAPPARLGDAGLISEEAFIQEKSACIKKDG